MPLARFDTWVRSTIGPAAAGTLVYICSQPAVSSTIPPSPLIPLFADSGAATSITQPLTCDGFGHAFAYCAAGTYTVVLVGGGRIQQVYPDQAVGGSGSSSSIILQTNGTPNTVQSLLNLKGSGTVSVSSDGSGGVTIFGAPSQALVQNAQVGTTYAIQDGDRGKYITFSNSASVAVSIAQAGTAGNFSSGWYCYVENLGLGQVTITPAVSTINNWPTIVVGQYQSALITTDGVNYFTRFTKIASTDPASALSAYLLNDAGIAVSQNQVVMQDISGTGINTKRKALNVYFENDGANGNNLSGLQINAGLTVTANTKTVGYHMDALEIFGSVSGAAVTAPQLNLLKLRSLVDTGTHLTNLLGILEYLPTWRGTIDNFFGFGIDTPAGGGTVTNYTSIAAGLNFNGITVAHATGISSYLLDSAVTSDSYAFIGMAKTASIVVDDSTSGRSFIGHGDVNSLTRPIPLHDGWYSVTGTPEASLAANVGSICSRRDGSTGTAFYVKETGTGNTGWSAFGAPVAFKTSNQGWFLGAKDLAPILNDTGHNISTNGTVYAVQVMLNAAWTISRAAAFVVTGNGVTQNFTAGIYNAAGTTLLVNAGAAAFDTTASQKYRSVTLGSPVVLPAGVYWFAWGSNGTTGGSVICHDLETWFQQMLNGLDISAPQTAPTRFATAANALSGNALPATLGVLTPLDNTNAQYAPVVLFGV